MSDVSLIQDSYCGSKAAFQIEWINPITDNRWRAFITGNSSSGIFHHPAWLNLLGSYSRKDVLATCLIRNNTILSGIPILVDSASGQKRQAFSIPCMNNGQAILTASEPYSTDTILIKSAEAQHISHFTIRDNLADTILPRTLQGYIHFLDITPPVNTLFSEILSPHCRRNIRKSERSNVHISTHTDEEAVRSFHRLHVLTRKRQGLPAIPLSFFILCYKKLIEPGLGLIIQVKVNSQVVCSGIFAGFNQIFSFKYGASHPGFSDCRPSYAMLWAAIQYAHQQGFGLFDFGRCELSNEGLRRFKRSWGAKEQPLYYSYFPTIPKVPVSHSTIKSIIKPVIKIAPGTFAKTIGEAAYNIFPMMLT